MKKPEKPAKIVTLPSHGASEKDVRKAAKALGIPAEKLGRLLDFIGTVEETAHKLDLNGPELVNACITICASTIKDFCPKEQQGEVVSGIFQVLWSYMGLPSDFKPDD